jgi:hypothetical protein
MRRSNFPHFKILLCNTKICESEKSSQRVKKVGNSCKSRDKMKRISLILGENERQRCFVLYGKLNSFGQHMEIHIVLIDVRKRARGFFSFSPNFRDFARNPELSSSFAGKIFSRHHDFHHLKALCRIFTSYFLLASLSTLKTIFRQFSRFKSFCFHKIS